MAKKSKSAASNEQSEQLEGQTTAEPLEEEEPRNGGSAEESDEEEPAQQMTFGVSPKGQFTHRLTALMEKVIDGEMTMVEFGQERNVLIKEFKVNKGYHRVPDKVTEKLKELLWGNHMVIQDYELLVMDLSYGGKPTDLKPFSGVEDMPDKAAAWVYSVVQPPLFRCSQAAWLKRVQSGGEYSELRLDPDAKTSISFDPENGAIELVFLGPKDVLAKAAAAVNAELLAVGVALAKSNREEDWKKGAFKLYELATYNSIRSTRLHLSRMGLKGSMKFEDPLPPRWDEEERQLVRNCIRHVELDPNDAKFLALLHIHVQSRLDGATLFNSAQIIRLAQRTMKKRHPLALLETFARKRDTIAELQTSLDACSDAQLRTLASSTASNAKNLAALTAMLTKVTSKRQAEKDKLRAEQEKQQGQSLAELLEEEARGKKKGGKKGKGAEASSANGKKKSDKSAQQAARATPSPAASDQPAPAAATPPSPETEEVAVETTPEAPQVAEDVEGPPTEEAVATEVEAEPEAVDSELAVVEEEETCDLCVDFIAAFRERRRMRLDKR